MMYNKKVQEYFFHPLHVGTLDIKTPLTVYHRKGPNQQGVVIDLYMRCMEQRYIEALCFKTNGNPYHIAALEWFCRQAVDKPLEHIGQTGYLDIMDALGLSAKELPIIVDVHQIFIEILALMKQKFEDK